MLHDVVIVGAGAAGISAARVLREHNVESVLLEARDRTGGRAWTDSTAFGAPLDMGCAWLHSADRNPWTRYARSAGFEVIEREPVWQRHIGREEASADYLHRWHAAFERNDARITAAATANRDVPVSELVPHDEFRPMFDAVMGWLMGVDSQCVSSVDYARYQDSDHNWSVPAGLGTVVSHAGIGLNVRVSTPVRRVDYRRNEVRVETDAGSIDARAIIVTVPPSLLARGDIRFLPEVPVAYAEALAAVPLGAPNKVFFRVAQGAMPFTGTTHFIGTDRDAHTCSYETRPANQEGVLVAFFGGAMSVELEAAGELEHFARAELARIFGSGIDASLQSAVATGWHNDPWARGAYSAALPGRAFMRERLSDALDDKVFFAGEACSTQYFGTIIGAHQTGVAAAQRVLQKLRRNP